MRRSLAIALVACALVVAVGLVAGANADTFTTDTHFANAQSLDNLTIDGSGTSASLKLEGSFETNSRPSDTGSFQRSDKSGLEIEANKDIDETTISISSQTSGLDFPQAYLQTSGGSNIETASVSNGEATFQTDLSAGTTYRVVVDDQGDPWNIGSYGSASYPYGGTNVDITASYRGGSRITGQALAIDSVTTTTGLESTGEYVSQSFDADAVGSGSATVDPGTGSIDVIWEQDDDGDGSWTQITSSSVTSAGTNTQSFVSEYDTVRVRAGFSPASGTASMTLDSASVDFTASSPAVDNAQASPQGNTRVNSDPVTLSIPVNDSDFALAQSDSLTVDFYVNGNLEDTQTITSNQTVTTDVSVATVGSVDWNVTVSDDYGNSVQSNTFTFETPSTLTIREAGAPHALVTGSTLEVTFFSDDSTTIVDRTDDNNDGKISLSGLPNDAFVAQIQHPDYHQRTIFITSLFDQSNAFVLNSTAHAGLEKAFEVEDQTGKFDDPDETEIIIKRVINTTEYGGGQGLTYLTVAGDELGSDSRYTVDLEEGVRYRIQVRNDDGDVRQLGAFTPAVAGVTSLDIGSIRAQQQNRSDIRWAAFSNETSSGEEIVVAYNDTQDLTDTLYVEIHERNNRSNKLLQNTSFNGPLGDVALSEPVPAAQNDTDWVVRITGDRDGAGDFTALEPLTPQQGVLPGLPAWLTTVLSLGVIWVVAGLFSQVNGDVGALVVAGIGGMFWFVDFVPGTLGVGVVILSMVTAGLIYINDRNDGGL